MMTIEGVLHLRGSEMNLYSPRYFKESPTGPVEQFIEMLKGGGVILMGQEMRNHSPTLVTLDGDLVRKNLNTLEITYGNRVFTLDKKNKSPNEDWVTPIEWFVANPPIPPENGWLTSTRTCNMWHLRNRYLAERDKTAPKYYSVDRDTDNWIIVNDKTSADLILVQKKNVCNLSRCIFFVNGLCCFATIEENSDYGMQVRLHDGTKYLRNQGDRSRGIVVVDFDAQCKVGYYPTSAFAGNLPELIVNDTINPTENSYLLVLDGRLYLPDEFVVFSDHQMKIKVSTDHPEYQLDRMCCENNFTEMLGQRAVTRTIVADKIDLKEAGNSFLIVLNKTGLKVVQHANHFNPSLTSTMDSRMCQAEFHRAIFNGCAKGLMFDWSTRSICDYVREEDSMTFYDDEATTPRYWKIVNCRTNPTTLLEIWGKYNNDMSASASMHDRSDVRGSAFLLKPKYTMLDFIFEG